MYMNMYISFVNILLFCRAYDNQNSGTFIMYRNIDSDNNVMEVNSKFIVEKIIN